MKKLEIGDLIKGTGCNADILKAVVTREPWEEIEIEWVELKVINSTKPEAIGKTFSICTSYLEEINPEESAQKVKRFETGNHVKGLKGSGYYISNENLIDAEVISGILAGGDINIKCLRFLDGNTENVGLVLPVDPKYFDYADGYSQVSGTVASYMINGHEYSNEQFGADCKRFVREFPNGMNIELPQSMNTILTVYKWAQQNPVVTNLDHYAEEFGWTEDRKKGIADSICPLCYLGFWSSCPRPIYCKNCRKWWLREWKGGKA